MMGDFLTAILGRTDGTAVLTLDAYLLRLLAALVLSQVVAWIYISTHRGISYTASVAQALVVMALIVTLVMAVIGNNIAQAFGLFGALALIRFRTPVKDARDTVFLFLAVALGIACGTGNITAGIAGTVVIGLVLWHLAATGFGAKLGHDGLLRLRAPAGAETLLNAALGRHCERVKLLHMRDAGADALEFAYEIGLEEPESSSRLLADVRSIVGVAGVSLLIQDSEAMP
jgi:hypothetical protein